MMKKFLLILVSMLLFTASAFAYGNPRWAKMPVTVYVEKTAGNTSAVNAFKSWQTATRGTVRFVFHSSKNTEKISNISVEFSDSFAGGLPYNVEKRFSNVFAHYKNAKHSFYYHTVITISKRDANGKLYSSNQLYAIALRAVGEALGIAPFETDNNAVMSKEAKKLSTTITSEDINAINDLYKK